MGELSAPLRAVSVFARLSEAEKAKLTALARECDVSLSDALRKGALLYLEDLRELRIAQRTRSTRRLKV